MPPRTGGGKSSQLGAIYRLKGVALRGRQGGLDCSFCSMTPQSQQKGLRQ